MSLIFLFTSFIVGTTSTIILLLATKKRHTAQQQQQQQQQGGRSLTCVQQRSYGSTGERADVHTTPTINQPKVSSEVEEEEGGISHLRTDSNIVESTHLMSSAIDTSRIQNLGPLPSVGFSHRDESGLSRFVVLVVFLLLSCLVVSCFYHFTICIHIENTLGTFQNDFRTLHSVLSCLVMFCSTSRDNTCRKKMAT